MLFKKPRGTQDILSPEVYNWLKIEDIIRSLCTVYGYEEIRTPVFEYTELFSAVVWDKQLTLWKKRCILLPTEAAAT